MSRPCVGAVAIVIVLGSVAFVEPVHAEGGRDSNLQGGRSKTIDGYLSFYLLGSVPKNKNLVLEGIEVPQTTVGGGIGGGFKAGLYPAFTGRIVGLEGETFAHGSTVKAPLTTIGGVTRFADADVVIVSTMVNLLVRYPGAVLQPYGGLGGGMSSGYLFNADLRKGPDRVTGFDSTITLAYQFLAGVRANLPGIFFLFGEYRYFVADYRWDTDASSGVGLTASLDLRSHLIAGGLGVSF